MFAARSELLVFSRQLSPALGITYKKSGSRKRSPRSSELNLSEAAARCAFRTSHLLRDRLQVHKGTLGARPLNTGSAKHGLQIRHGSPVSETESDCLRKATSASPGTPESPGKRSNAADSRCGRLFSPKRRGRINLHRASRRRPAGR